MPGWSLKLLRKKIIVEKIKLKLKRKKIPKIDWVQKIRLNFEIQQIESCNHTQ